LKNFINKIIKFIKLINNKNWRNGLFNNIAANIELENLIKDLDIKIIIDAGSNKGQFILLTENFFNCNEIYSFEPIKEIFEKQKKFFNYKKNIFFYNFALGDKNEYRIFNITKRNDSSSFLKINDSIKKHPDYLIKEKRKIEIKKLDDVMKNKIINKTAILKIDVQGFELEVLKGAIETIQKVKYILVEVSKYEIYKNQSLSNNVIDFLKKNNFFLLKKNETSIIKKTNFTQEDILFENRSIL
tara:strand:+ start:107 stop:835 length:729 start_codon:yes stop_codon:yes gene_type:complete